VYAKQIHLCRAHAQVRHRVRAALVRHTQRTLSELQSESDAHFRAVDWQAVARYVAIGVDRGLDRWEQRQGAV
jgi:hypothetical protein